MSTTCRARICARLRGRGGPGGSESSDAGLGSDPVEEGRGPRVARDPAAPSDEERKRRECTHVPFRSWCAHCARG
eukprot:3755544-Alexandrium_andersonii.AAC.1